MRVIIDQVGTESWKLIASQIRGRTMRQCRDRWFNYLAPELNLPWTDTEDAILLREVRNLGCDWTQIARFFPNRANINCKNRWHVLLKSVHSRHRNMAIVRMVLILIMIFLKIRFGGNNTIQSYQ